MNFDHLSHGTKFPSLVRYFRSGNFCPVTILSESFPSHIKYPGKKIEAERQTKALTMNSYVFETEIVTLESKYLVVTLTLMLTLRLIRIPQLKFTTFNEKSGKLYNVC